MKLSWIISVANYIWDVLGLKEQIHYITYEGYCYCSGSSLETNSILNVIFINMTAAISDTKAVARSY